MAYKKKVWKTGDIMKQEDINNIENGIYEAHQELKNLHNYDDTEIKNIIGSGTLSTLAKDLKGAINEVFQYASNGKTLIAQAITGKGVATSNTDTFQTMATNISLISGKVTGKILTLDNKKYTLSEDDNGNITATIIKFSITNKLTNVSNSNSAIQIDYGNSYSATITANSGYGITSISITMGGVDITSTVYSNGQINISSVTGNIIITVTASATIDISGSFGSILGTITEWEVVGDSITDEGMLPLTKYPTILKNQYTNISTVNNCAKSGAHITNKTTGYKTFSTLIDEGLSGASANAGLVTIFGGVNDYLQNCDIGTTNDTEDTTFYGACKKLIEKIKNKFAQAEIIWIIPLNMTNGTFNTNSNGINNAGNTLDDYRTAIKNVCTTNNIKIIDVHEDSDLQPSTLSSDGLHPTADGQGLLASKFRKYIPRIPAQSTTELTVSNIADITTVEKITFNIVYSTSKSVIKHEVSWDGGNTFYDKTSDVTSNNLTYTFTHDANANAGTYNMAIRVTTSDGEIATSNIFTLTVMASPTQDTYTNAVISDFKTVGKVDDLIIDSSSNLTASSVGQWGMCYLNKNISKLKFTLRPNVADYACLCWYIYNDNGDGTYNMIALGIGSDHGQEFKMTIPGTGASKITKLTLPDINKNDILIVEYNGTSQKITKEDGTALITLEGNMSGWCGQSSSSIPFCSNVKYIEKENTDTVLLDSNGAYIVDDFSSNMVDPSKWSYELGYVRNSETQNYVNTNAIINDGILELRGLKDSSGNWTSSSIISKGHFAFMYGKIEARVKLCNSNGAFGAFWTLGDSFEFGYKENGSPDTLGEWWAYCGEFDIVEFYNKKLTCGTFFNQREESGRVWYDNYTTGDWHIFAMEWKTDGTLIFSIDGNELSRTNATDNRAFHIPHFILLNQAIGASGGTPDSDTTEITQYVDWVKYYPLSTENVVLNSSDFTIQATDFNENNCVVRATFNDNCINKALSWKSNNESVITVHSGFCVAASSSGSATITATSKSGVSKSITLNVSNNAISH